MRPMDRIKLKELRFFGHHGILPEEQENGQHFMVSLWVGLDLSTAGKSDDLESGVDYREIIRLTGEVIEGPPVKLLETLAERIAERILTQFPAVDSLTVEVGKSNPPISIDSAGTFVEITRRREKEATPPTMNSPNRRES